MSVIIDTSMHEVDAVIKYARYGANNCMIGNGWEIKELVHCRDCKWYVPFTMENKTHKMCRKAHLGSDDFFCADGERREQCSSQDS